MKMKSLSLAVTFFFTLTTLFLVSPADSSWASKDKPFKKHAAEPESKKVVGWEFIGEVIFPTGYIFKGTEVGGLSGITYDPKTNRYYALSDDRSDINPARYYTVKITVADGELIDKDIEFRNVTILRDQRGRSFPAGSIDPEGIAHTRLGQLYICSEGDANNLIDPFVNEFTRKGRQMSELPVDPKFLPRPGGASGIRNNLAFESLTITPNGRYLYTAVENALVQDGPAADVEQESLARIIKYDMLSGKAVGEFVYTVDAVPEVPDPSDAFRTNGLVELLALDNNGTLLALERLFSVGKGNTVKLYEVRTQGALDVIDESDLFWEEEGIPFEIDPPVAKELILDFFADLGIMPDNLEGMTFGPKLSDGRQTLIVVSDNNFNPSQKTQFIALALELDTIPAALPVVETPQAIDEEDAPSPLQGDSDDPAIWVHPVKPWKSLVIATQKDGGLVVFDLNGKVRQVILPVPFGDIRYNNVDLVYGFKLGRKYVDLAVVSDRENDTLAIFKIDPRRRRLMDVTAPNMIETIFGEDDGEQTAYGLCTYTSPKTGKSFAFVTQADGNFLAQLKLFDNGSDAVSAEVVRTLALPVPTGDPEDSQAEGIVADRELGILYVAVEDEVGIVKTSAEPDGSGLFENVQPIDAEFLEPDIEGLSIYYGPDETGYLLVSSQGDSTFAVLERSGDNAYLGSFVVGDRLSIDQVNECDGADVINVSLGPRFPFGLLVVQDGANNPQNVVQDDEELENNSTNFKFVPWENVAGAFPRPLMVDPYSYNPRQ